MRSFLIIILVGVFLAIGVLAYLMSQKLATVRPQSTMEVDKNGQSIGDSGETLSRKYVNFTDSALNNSSGRRVLFFYANWCPTCRPADTNIKANADKLPNDLTVIRVNYNDAEADEKEKALAQKYGVTYQHTFVQIDVSGNEVAKWNGGAYPEILKNIK